MIVAVVGSRGLSGPDFSLFLPKDTKKIVSGGAKGIDRAAVEYAKEHGIAFEEILPEYEKYGRAAPIKRNRDIVLSADLVLIFWDGVSKGTKSSLELCKKEKRRYKLFLWRSGGYFEEEL